MTSADHPDAAVSQRIRGDLDATLFVEAGAGSGKTRALVDRVVALIIDGGASLSSIAAITFTEKAATELRDRVRHELEAVDDPHAKAALDELDSAAIGTLHSFAQRILGEHPIEAGLPPRIEVLDEVASTVAFDDRWSSFVDQVLDDPELARPILLVTAGRVKLADLREIALSFNQNWDLVAERVTAEPTLIPPVDESLKPLLDEMESLCALRDFCIEADDLLCCALDSYAEWGKRLRRESDEPALLELLRRPPRFRSNGGKKQNWPGQEVRELKQRLREIRDAGYELANEIAHDALVRLAVEMREFTLAAAAQRRREGQLEFHDLLVMARQLLRDQEHGAEVRASLARRYQRLLIDEFQDTDPIQVDLAVLIASADPDAATKPWHEIDTQPGRLFFVGDPKQSIYRFRRADIGVFLAAAEQFGVGDNRLSLSTNHRSGKSLLAWLNQTFGILIVPDPATPGSQPEYELLQAVRNDAPSGPAVSVIGRVAHNDGARADDVREREADEVAAAIGQILSEGWMVDKSKEWSQPDWQPACAGDITILLPTRASLPFLEDALTQTGIAYKTESASLVYSSRPIRDLFLTLRAIDEPSDELITVAALRSPLFGCGDDDLYTYRKLGGRFDHSRSPSEDVPDEHPVAQGLAYMRSMHERRRWMTPSELIDQVVRDRRVLELGEDQRRARDLWQRVRFVTDQARAWTDTTSGTLRQFLDWVRLQSAPGSRVAEAVLPETDDDAVRIMTIHAAKGLQFPITIVTGMSSKPVRSYRGAQVEFPRDGGCIFRVGSRVTSPAYEAWRPIDEQMSVDERVRLLYVACTRARDHLVLSLHRCIRKEEADTRARLTNAELLVDAMADDLAKLPDTLTPTQLTLPVGSGPHIAPARAHSEDQNEDPPPFELWERDRARALQQSSRPRTVAATALTDDGQADTEADDGLKKRPGDLDRPPWRKGRYGSAIGRAVHGVLQVIDLASGDGLDGAVAAQAAAEGVVGHEQHIRQLVNAALASAAVQEAARSPHWREIHVAVPVSGDRTIEGYIDLLYRRPQSGLVVVDYKTGPRDLDVDLDPLVQRYRLQGASYALAVAKATGEEVVEMNFVFLTPLGAIERAIDDLPTAVSETAVLIENGTFATIG